MRVLNVQNGPEMGSCPILGRSLPFGSLSDGSGCQRQRPDRPSLQFARSQLHGAVQSLAVALHADVEIDMAHGFHQDFQRPRFFALRQNQAFLPQAAVQRADEFSVQVHLRVIAGTGQFQRFGRPRRNGGDRCV